MLYTRDDYNAFLDYMPVDVPVSREGPLAGLTFAVKDIYDVAGYPTGCGNPLWLAESQPARASAPIVQRMLDAGAWFVGKTQTDELAFSLAGQNKHFPHPVNPRAPGRITGGSSSGSAAAVAAHLCDFSIGSDTGGSVRAPASFCGLWGIRPTHGRVPLDGVMPMAPSFDTAGYFADRADVFRLVAGPFLGGDTRFFAFRRLMWARQPFAAVHDDAAKEAMRQSERIVSAKLGAAEPVDAAPVLPAEAYEAFRVLQAYEAWRSNGAWIEAHDPDMTPGVRERYEFGATVSEEMVADANSVRASVRGHLERLLGSDGLLMLPSTPTVAPPADMPAEDMIAFRDRTLPVLCLGGLSGLPQVSMPLAQADGLPIGMSLMGPRGSDRALVNFCVALAETE